MHHDGGVAYAFLLDQPEQDGGVVRIEPHAAVRGRSAKPRNFVSAVDGVAAIEEDVRGELAPLVLEGGQVRVLPAVDDRQLCLAFPD